MELLPISIYRKMLNQSINIGNWQAGGKFEMLDASEKKTLLSKQFEEFEAFNRAMKEKTDGN